MRALIIAIVCASGVARADTGFESKVQVYADDDHTTVVSPTVSATADVTADTNVSLGYLADVVTSASVDIVTQASPTTIHDTRHQVSAGASHVFGALTLRGGYSFSQENDYQSNTFNVGGSRELNDKDTTLALGYTLSLNAVGRAGDRNFEQDLDVHMVSASWTQIVSPSLVTQVSYELGGAFGFQSSPYRFVPIRAGLDAMPTESIAETDPDTRWRHALVVAANRAVFDDSSIQGDYRIYHDTWGITSHTIGARYFVNFGKKVELRLRSRFYTQNAASFYQAVYTSPQQYMAYDRELSPLWSETIGGKLMYQMTDRLEAEAKLDVFYYSYSDFPPLSSRTGANVGVGLSLTY
ncbi:MAG TPA: DUF3570 domain-containing protein [Kofleriaceae bacterium]|nr:DUF3570 domain-containing protein [Kofleriaceae bacterium]